MAIYRRLFRLAWLAVAMLFYSGSFAQRFERVDGIATDGVIDLRNIDFSRQLVELDGQWWLHPFVLLAPGDNFSNHPRQLQNVTTPWGNVSTSQGKLKANGYATYRVKVLLPPGLPNDMLALQMPNVYSSFRLYVDNELILQSGRPDTSYATTVPGYEVQPKRLWLSADTLWITFQVANFHHRRGGPYQPMVLGSNDKLKLIKEQKRAFDLFLTGALIMGGLFFLGLYLLSRKDRVILYFALLCILYSYRIIGSGDHTVLFLYPNLNWFIALRVEYVTLFSVLALLTLFSYTLYSQDYNKKVCYFFVAFSVLSSVLCIVLPTHIFTHLLNPFLVVMLVSLCYTFYTYYLAWRRSRPEAALSLVSAVVLFFIFLANSFSYLNYVEISSLLLLVAYIVFFFIHSLVLSYRFASQLKRARQEALHASRAKSDFLNTMSHEIRTPLNSVIGISTLMQQTEKDPESKDLIETLKISAANLLFVINDILDFSKLEAGKTTIVLQPALLSKVGNDVIKTIFILVKEKGLELKWTIDKALYTQYVMVDEQRTAQVLLNLLQNAIKFTQKGFVKLEMKVTAQTSDTIKVIISVEDTGIGIPLEKQKIIFDHFTQVDSSVKRGYGGTGLGLAICKEILARQGVKLELTSQMDIGSSFWFEQTFKKAKAPTTKDADKLQVSKEMLKVLEGKRILVAEDNPVNLMLTQKLLNNAIPGLIFYTAINGKNAVDAVLTHAPDLVLMDLHMPEMDGFEATNAIRNFTDKKLSLTPIVALTAGTPREDEPRCVAAGMDGMVPKPFTIEEMVSTIVPILLR